jgi:hypothetical protein
MTGNRHAPCISIVRTRDRGVSWRGLPAPVVPLGEPGIAVTGPVAWGIRFATPEYGFALGGNIYKFQNIGTGRCLEARNGAVNGGAVDLWPCESSESNERWYWPPSATPGQSPFPGFNPIQTRVSGSTGFCPDVPGAQITPGLQMQVYRCNGTLAQQFWVVQ